MNEGDGFARYAYESAIRESVHAASERARFERARFERHQYERQAAEASRRAARSQRPAEFERVLIRALREAGAAGLKTTQIHRLANRKMPADDLHEILERFERAGIVCRSAIETGGRTATVWTLTTLPQPTKGSR